MQGNMMYKYSNVSMWVYGCVAYGPIHFSSTETKC